jgi:hypothetical protein
MNNSVAGMSRWSPTGLVLWEIGYSRNDEAECQDYHMRRLYSETQVAQQKESNPYS